MNPILGLLGLFGIVSYAAKKAANNDEKPTKKSDLGTQNDPFFAYDSLFQSAACRYGVPVRWIKAFCSTESSLGRNPRVARGIQNPTDVEGSKSTDAKSWGIMQVVLKTANFYQPGVTAADLNDPETSVEIAAQLIADFMKRFPGQRQKIVISYNQGETATAKGKDYTGNYYAKWVSALNEIQRRQPGGEMDLSF